MTKNSRQKFNDLSLVITGVLLITGGSHFLSLLSKHKNLRTSLNERKLTHITHTIHVVVWLDLVK